MRRSGANFPAVAIVCAVTACGSASGGDASGQSGNKGSQGATGQPTGTATAGGNAGSGSVNAGNAGSTGARSGAASSGMAGGASGAPASTAQGAADAGVFQAPSIVDAPLDGGSAAGDGTEAGAVTSQQDAGSPGSGDGGIFADPFAAHNVAVINQYRAGANLPPYVLDSTLSAFALAGAVELSMDHMPHQHFINAEAMGTLFIPASGFRTAAGENQGDPNGWRITSTDPTTNELTQIDQIQAQMYAEGPTGGHYQNMMSTKFTRIGIGLLEVANQLYLCNDFSN